MAVASVSVILTVVVLKLHHCSPHQKKIPRWVRHFVLGHLAKIVRCSCIKPCKNLSRKSSTYESEVGMKELQTKLLRQMENITLKNGSSGLNIETSSRNNVNANARNLASMNEMNNSKANLDLREFSISNRSSMNEEEAITTARRDRSLTTMEDILKYLKVLVIKSDAEDAENEVVDEWKQVALIVDRLFFWLFLLITILSSVVILVIVPSFKYVADDGI